MTIILGHCSMRRLFVACCLLAVGTEAPSFDYCQIKCKDKAHTMCTYPLPTPGSACGSSKSHPLTDAGKDDILATHNDFRGKVARGEVIVHHPQASNMNKLYWDEELELIAQRWADQCMFKHDDCRKTSTNRAVGQNIYIGFTSNLVFEEKMYDVGGWKAEGKDVTEELLESFGSVDVGAVVAHYTQMVWALTERIGCARSVYMDNSKNMLSDLIVCNYEPAGNWLGDPVYKRGRPCSACPNNGKCSAKYRGICIAPGDTDIGAASRLNTLGLFSIMMLVATQLFLQWL